MVQADLSRVGVTPGFTPEGKGKLTFHSLHTRKKFKQRKTLLPKAGIRPCLPASAIHRALLAAGCNLEH